MIKKLSMFLLKILLYWLIWENWYVKEVFEVKIFFENIMILV